jgi:hypothetical protein
MACVITSMPVAAVRPLGIEYMPKIEGTCVSLGSAQTLFLTAFYGDPVVIVTMAAVPEVLWAER